MDARQIQTMRALLATQKTPDGVEAPNPARELLRIMTPRPAPWTPVLLLGDGQARPEPILQSEAGALLRSVAPTPPADPVPPEILLGDIIPRRSAFGQRSEAVLELREPEPTPAPQSQRLILLAADGAAVGEIVLHAADIPFSGAQAKRPFEPLHSEAPFFPEDLADEPGARPSRVFGKAVRKVVPLPAPPPRELAAAFLLADLAARLASEEAALRYRLLTAKAAAQIAPQIAPGAA